MFSSAFSKPKSDEYYHDKFENFNTNEVEELKELNELRGQLELEEELDYNKIREINDLYHKIYDESHDKYIKRIEEKSELTEETIELIKNYNSIKLGHYSNISIDNLPDNIKKISWYNCHNYTKQIGKFPRDLRILDFSSISNELQNQICPIPNTVKVIKMPSNNIDLPNLPDDLEILSLSYKNLNKFQSLNMMGKLVKLKKLEIGLNYRHEDILDINLNILPENLEILLLQSLPKTSLDLTNLPTKLKKLTMIPENGDFTLDFLPGSLELLYVMSNKFSKSIDMLPAGLKKLTFYSNDFDKELCNLPKNLKILDLKIHSTKTKINEFPENLKNLKLNIMSSSNQILVLDSNIQYLNYFPSNLINLSIGSNFLSNNIVLPESLETLEIFNPDIVIHGIPEFSFVLPKNLKYFKINEKINFKFINMPETLEHLYLNEGFKEILPNFPESLKTFYFNSLGYPHKINNFNQGLVNLYLSYYNSNPECKVPELPDSLESLYLNFIIYDDFILPKNLKYLGFEPYYIVEPESSYPDGSTEYFNRRDELDKKFLELENKLLNSMPDSLEIFSTKIYINQYKFTRLPENLKEIGIYNRELTNDGFDYVGYFKDCGCTNNFDNIIFYLVEDNSDIRNFKYRVKNYFDTYKFYEYNYDYDYEYDYLTDPNFN